MAFSDSDIKQSGPRGAYCSIGRRYQTPDYRAQQKLKDPFERVAEVEQEKQLRWAKLYAELFGPVK